MDPERENYDDEPGRTRRPARVAVLTTAAVLAGLVAFVVGSRIVARIVAERFMVWN